MIVNLTPSDLPDPKQVIAISSFPSGLNAPVFSRQVLEAGTETAVLGVFGLSTDVVILYASAPSASTLSAVAGLVAAHSGASFSEEEQSWDIAASVSVATNIPVDVLVIDTGILPEGEYRVSFYAEHRMSVDDVTSYSNAAFLVGSNGAALANFAADSNMLGDWDAFSGNLKMSLLAGDSIQAKFLHQRLTRAGQVASGGNAELRRCRISVAKAV